MIAGNIFVVALLKLSTMGRFWEYLRGKPLRLIPLRMQFPSGIDRALRI